MTTLRGFGAKVPFAASKLQLSSGPAPVKEAVYLFPGSRAAEPTVSLEAEDGDLVEVELENGAVFWTSMGQLREDVRGPLARSGGEEDWLPTHYGAGRGLERGPVGQLIKALKILDVDVAEGAAKLAARKIEAQLAGPPGLYRIDPGGELHPDRLPSGSQPALVFIHGTASSTRGAYGDLFLAENALAWKKLQETYPGRIFAFEHRTLTESPAQNAILFLETAGEGPLPPLHLVSHSRGGLVGDLLALGEVANPFSRNLLDAFGIGLEPERDDQVRARRQLERKYFERLNELLVARRPQVARFVRVASPSGGTSMASGRLDIYLSLLFVLLSRVPLFGPFLGALGDLLAAVAKERKDPSVLPGLEAQMPKSGLVKLLNAGGYELDSDLTVIAGDSDGILKNLANLYFWHANDLVVDTRSMFRGVPRRHRRWFRAEGKEVSHVNYFARHETVGKLLAGLLRADGDDAGFSLGQPRGGAPARGAGPRGAAGDPGEMAGRPAVVLVPGLFGSHLRIRQEGGFDRVWLDFTDLLQGRFASLAIAAPGVEADALLGRVFGPFAAFLQSREQHVIPFPYDWRRSFADAAAGLARLLEERLAASEQPIRLVAHSTGGLVARCLMAAHPELWSRLKARGGRLVQLGTPNRGFFLPPLLLQGRERLLRMLTAFDQPGRLEPWCALLAAFPGVLEAAPRWGPRDFFEAASWDEPDAPALCRPAPGDLAAARRTAARLDEVELRHEPVIYVAGVAPATPTLEAGDPRIRYTARGDGRVTWESGIPEGVPRFFLAARHGDLASHAPSFEGLLELIVAGGTRRLSSNEPSRRQAGPFAAPSAEEIDREVLEVFPTQDSLETAALGMSPDEPGLPADRGPRCQVSVVHGDLTYAKHPVMVGHYAGDPILSAEAVLDRRLSGKLSARHLLGLYPRAIGSHEIVLAAPQDGEAAGFGAGAIVLGLGESGALTPGGLTRAVTEALVRYARLMEERESFPREGGGLAVTSLLIGSGEMGLSLDQVLQSLLIGVRLANQRLRSRAKGERAAGIEKLELMEVYQDRALEALRTLRRLTDGSFGDFEVERELGRSAGGRRRTSFTEPGGWWTPLVIAAAQGDGGGFDFTAFGQRARAVPEQLEIQWELVEKLLGGTLAASPQRHRCLSETLFELLLPQRLKKAAADRQNVLLVVDEAAAPFPWEMLIDRFTPGERPVGVDAGLVRQLRLGADAEKARFEVTHPEELQALVVGDPPSEMPALPGAREEARRVADLLENRSWKVVRQIRGDGPAEIDVESILCAAMSADYRILHLAGHGVYDPDRPSRSGLVLAGGVGGSRSRPVLFSPAEVRQMRLVPELVFINCCHLGRIERTPFHLLAANLATQFICNGVKAVVAAGWAVDDDAALEFAGAFYDEMFRGATFGGAVAEARRRTYDRLPSSITWAAYQCYGDPGFRLTMDPGTRQAAGGGRTDQPVDPVELEAELENLISLIRTLKTAGAADTDYRPIAKTLEDLAEEAERRGWLDRGEIGAGLARVYGELGDFAGAIRYYERARSCESGAGLRDLDQLANLRARWAAESAAGGKIDAAAAVKEIERSIAELESLLSFSVTKERSAALASAYKKLSGFKKNLGKNLLARMAIAYATAAEAAPDDPLYPGLNALAAILALGGPWPAGEEPFGKGSGPGPIPFAEEGAFDRALAAYRLLAPALARQELGAGKPRDFWNQTYELDAELLAALRGGSAGPAADAALAGRYRGLLAAFGTPREHESVLAHLDFLAARIPASATLIEVLRQLEPLRGGRRGPATG